MKVHHHQLFHNPAEPSTSDSNSLVDADDLEVIVFKDAPEPVIMLPVTFDLLKMKPEDIAAQITLEDLPIFRNITATELETGAWTNQKTKYSDAPYVTGMTLRFNLICHWVQREILSSDKVAYRASLIEYFIKVAKKLLDMNNIHASFAVVSALLCQSIFRLKLTWNKVGRSDKQTFDKLTKLFSAENNWQNLREHTDTRKSPCIPHLGVYLTDLLFVKDAMKRRNTPLLLGEKGRHEMTMDAIIRSIASFQDSVYPFNEDPAIKAYLMSMCSDRDGIKAEAASLYKRSLEVEPDDPMSLAVPSASTPRRSSMSRLSHFSIRRKSSTPIPPETPTSCIPAHVRAKALCASARSATTRFVKGHKKTRSSGDADGCLGIDNTAFSHNDPEPTSSNNAASVDSLDHILNSSVLPEPLPEGNSVDSALYRRRSSNVCPEIFRMLKPRRSSSIHSNRRSEIKDMWYFLRHGEFPVDEEDQGYPFESFPVEMTGVLHRSLVRTSKKKPVLIRYSNRMYVELRGPFIVEYERKTIPLVARFPRELFKAKPRRILDLRINHFWTATHADGSNSFEMHDRRTGCVVAYRCDAPSEAELWTNALCRIMSDDREVDEHF
uniref:Ras-GEF domain-containing protein n=1 Tax=Panagrellus redivivus TaxID=6233 RepID=A0A7E4UMA4_PANRE